MSQFAKLFEFEDVGQVLVTIGRGDDGAAICVRTSEYRDMEPEVKSSYPDTDEGWDFAEDAFKNINADRALVMAHEMRQTIDDLFSKMEPG